MNLWILGLAFAASLIGGFLAAKGEIEGPPWALVAFQLGQIGGALFAVAVLWDKLA